MSETPVSPAKKGLGRPLKVLIALAALAVSFALGWRVMPKVWLEIKAALYGPPKAEEPAKPDLYVPAATAVFEDPVAETDSLIYYFYKDYCPYCRELEPLTAGLPGTVTLPDGRQSSVKLVCLNKVEEGPLKVITEYYAEHAVAEERQYVPAIVIGGRYLYLKAEIVPQLMEALTAGEGLETPLLNGAERVPAP